MLTPVEESIGYLLNDRGQTRDLANKSTSPPVFRYWPNINWVVMAFYGFVLFGGCIIIEPPPGPTDITGRVVSKQSGRPLDNIWVSTEPRTDEVLTEENGQFRMTGSFPSGSYTFRALDYSGKFSTREIPGRVITNGISQHILIELDSLEFGSVNQNLPPFIPDTVIINRPDIPTPEPP